MADVRCTNCAMPPENNVSLATNLQGNIYQSLFDFVKQEDLLSMSKHVQTEIVAFYKNSNHMQHTVRQLAKQQACLAFSGLLKPLGLNTLHCPFRAGLMVNL